MYGIISSHVELTTKYGNQPKLGTFVELRLICMIQCDHGMEKCLDVTRSGNMVECCI